MRGLGRLAAAAAVGLLCIASSFGVGATIVLGVEADLISPDPPFPAAPVTQMIYSLLYAPFPPRTGIGPAGGFQSVQPSSALWQLVIDPNNGLSAAEVAAALRRAYTSRGWRARRRVATGFLDRRRLGGRPHQRVLAAEPQRAVAAVAFGTGGLLCRVREASPSAPVRMAQWSPATASLSSRRSPAASRTIAWCST